MPSTQPLATHQFQSGEVDAALEFLKRMRSELRLPRKVRAWEDRVQVFDINGDFVELHGIGYPDADVTPLLDSINTVYKPESIHKPIGQPFKEYKTGRQDPWAKDRIM